MTPLPAVPTARRSPREAAMIAEVLEALGVQLNAADRSKDAGTESAALSEEVQELIAAAVSEINRVAPDGQLRGGIAPVLGSGVVQSLLRQRSTAAIAPGGSSGDTLDERR